MVNLTFEIFILYYIIEYVAECEITSGEKHYLSGYTLSLVWKGLSKLHKPKANATGKMWT